MNTEVSEVVINGVAYVRKDDVKESAFKEKETKCSFQEKNFNA
jgi:hypothetical protein